MKFTTAAVMLVLANAAHVHGDHGKCAIHPDPATGVVVVPPSWTEIGVEVFAGAKRVFFPQSCKKRHGARHVQRGVFLGALVGEKNPTTRGVPVG